MLQQRCEFEQRILFKVAFPPDRNFPHPPTGDHHSGYLCMLAPACFEKQFKKNNHSELWVARHKFIQSFFRFYKNDITQDAKTEVGEDERC